MCLCEIVNCEHLKNHKCDIDGIDDVNNNKLKIDYIDKLLNNCYDKIVESGLKSFRNAFETKCINYKLLKEIAKMEQI